jgi:hypothetical protein
MLWQRFLYMKHVTSFLQRTPLNHLYICIYPTVSKMLAVCFHTFYALLFNAPSVNVYVRLVLFISYLSIALDGSIRLSVWIYFPLSVVCRSVYDRYFRVVYFINAIFLSCTTSRALVSHFGYLFAPTIYLSLSCGLRIMFDILVACVFGHGFFYLDCPAVTLDTPVITPYENNFLFICVGWDILFLSQC